jgi:hypothetical protein
MSDDNRNGYEWPGDFDEDVEYTTYSSAEEALRRAPHTYCPFCARRIGDHSLEVLRQHARLIEAKRQAALASGRAVEIKDPTRRFAPTTLQWVSRDKKADDLKQRYGLNPAMQSARQDRVLTAGEQARAIEEGIRLAKERETAKRLPERTGAAAKKKPEPIDPYRVSPEELAKRAAEGVRKSLGPYGVTGQPTETEEEKVDG